MSEMQDTETALRVLYAFKRKLEDCRNLNQDNLTAVERTIEIMNERKTEEGQPTAQ